MTSFVFGTSVLPPFSSWSSSSQRLPYVLFSNIGEKASSSSSSSYSFHGDASQALASALHPEALEDKLVDQIHVRIRSEQLRQRDRLERLHRLRQRQQQIEQHQKRRNEAMKAATKDLGSSSSQTVAAEQSSPSATTMAGATTQKLLHEIQRLETQLKAKTDECDLLRQELMEVRQNKVTSTSSALGALSEDSARMASYHPSPYMEFLYSLAQSHYHRQEQRHQSTTTTTTTHHHHHNSAETKTTTTTVTKQEQQLAAMSTTSSSFPNQFMTEVFDPSSVFPNYAGRMAGNARPNSFFQPCSYNFGGSFPTTYLSSHHHPHQFGFYLHQAASPHYGFPSPAYSCSWSSHWNVLLQLLQHGLASTLCTKQTSGMVPN
ncbi:hypothetical protein ACA910_014360 [Epithemia clementina (nom. ined.)]